MSFSGFLIGWVLPLAAIWLLARGIEAGFKMLFCVVSPPEDTLHTQVLRPPAVGVLTSLSMFALALALSAFNPPLRAVVGLALAISVAFAVRRVFRVVCNLRPAARVPLGEMSAPPPAGATTSNALGMVEPHSSNLALLQASRHPEFNLLGRVIVEAWPDASGTERRRLLAVYLDPASRMAALLQPGCGPLPDLAASTIAEAVERVRGTRSDVGESIDVIAKVMRDRMAEQSSP